MLASLSCVLSCIACLGHSAATRTASDMAVPKDAPRQHADAVLLFLPASPHTREAWQSLSDELSDSFDVITRPVSDQTHEADIEREISAVRPRCVVLMGNAASNLYLQYQARHSGPLVPAVVLMTSFFEEQHPLFRNTTGVAYEVPGITTFVNLRTFVNRPIHRVGVLHRQLFSNYIRAQAELASVEQIQLVPVAVSPSAGAAEIRRGLERLILQERVDALWVLNDNALLTPELIEAGWLLALHTNPVAVVVGVGSLVDARLHFGSFAMLPDHSALGVQAADLVFTVQEEGWDASRVPLELPLSIESVVDLEWTREHLRFREDALERIDRIK
jgi:hypothetical protein